MTRISHDMETRRYNVVPGIEITTRGQHMPFAGEAMLLATVPST